MSQIRLRPYRKSDEDKILSWCSDEVTFQRWTFGLLGDYPVTSERFQKTADLMRFVATEDDEPVGFFTARNLYDGPEQMRFGYGIIAPDKRYKGIGKAMLQLGLDFAFNIYKTNRVTLGVLEDNMPGINCYTAIGFADTGTRESYVINGEEHHAIEMACTPDSR